MKRLTSLFIGLALLLVVVQPALVGASTQDSDGDGLSDGAELQGDPTCDPAKWDTDGDGWNDRVERRVGTSCRLRDSDGDGRNDPVDNCPVHHNPGQEDADRDGRGDACDSSYFGTGLEEPTAFPQPDPSDLGGEVERQVEQAKALLHDLVVDNPELADDAARMGTDSFSVVITRTGPVTFTVRLFDVRRGTLLPIAIEPGASLPVHFFALGDSPSLPRSVPNTWTYHVPSHQLVVNVAPPTVLPKLFAMTVAVPVTQLAIGSQICSEVVADCEDTATGFYNEPKRQLLVDGFDALPQPLIFL